MNHCIRNFLRDIFIVQFVFLFEYKKKNRNQNLKNKINCLGCWFLPVRTFLLYYQSLEGGTWELIPESDGGV